MHIDIENVVDQERIFHRILLITGRIKNFYKQASGESREKESSSALIFINHESFLSKARQVITYKVPVINSRFKFLFELTEGRNILTFEYKGVFKSLILYFVKDSDDVQKTVRIVYIVPRDSDGSFQAPVLEPNSVELACQKISLAVGLIQCFMSDSLHSHGLGRKTFVALSPCEVFHSEISLEKSHSLTESALWEYHAKELLARRLADDDTKVLAVLSATRFVNTLGRPPRDHSEMMSLTKSHGALGGGGLAMFGSGCLYAWPSLLHEVQDAFLNSSKIDSLNLMDDSGYRHTFGACFSTTLGAIIHELGHTFDLGHTNDGTDIPDVTMNGGSTSYLQAYQQKKELRRMVADSGKAFWSRSCALILSSHRWFNPVPKDTECNDVLPSLSLIGGILSVNCNGDGHVVLLELRKKR
ncbi:unnamed protein product [Lepeophtheirus salmonis]|uniref:(salmon louse) hypothetical protein n=1 Tax=Lepeophtheirus salmonis TaxID=72036 RepID=A0A7R8CIJ5_LEPSM|nr:unnamed protein product [Lepeophtheirus salmonis]CAF2832987.1 unnamed protein product [Lepeophtheirus salmonis]